MPSETDPNAIPCSKCGYDLRVTSLDAMCPECGLPVVQSKPGYRVEGGLLVVYPKANLPRQYCRAEHAAMLHAQGTTLQPASFLQRPLTQKVSILAVAMWVRVIAYSVPIVLFGLLILLPPLLEQARVLPPGPADDARVVAFPLLLLGLFVANAILRLVGTECKLTVYTAPIGILTQAGILVLGAVWFIGSLIVTGIVASQAYELFGRAGAIVATIVIMTLGVGVIYLLHRSTSIHLVRHDDGQFWLKGFGAGYLQTCINVRQRIHDETRAMEANRATNPANMATTTQDNTAAPADAIE